VGTVLSVLDASDFLTVVELGAGWAPWLAVSSRVAAKHKVNRVRLLGLEGSSAHAEFMRQHFKNNDIPLDENRLVHGIAGARDGTAEFPVADDPSADWGQAAFFGEAAGNTNRIDYRGFKVAKTETVPVYAIDTFLADEKLINLMHVDIQGAEADVIPAALDTLNKKVKAMVIGTHTRQIEGLLAATLTEAGWTLCREQACSLSLGTNSVSYQADGCQFWRNQRYFGRA
jgi:FkbM family methyltransferase